MTEPSTTRRFWQNPPWTGAKPKYRLGLAPIAKEQWFTQPISTAVLKHKQRMLSSQYDTVVAVMDGDESQAAQRQLSEYLPAEAVHADPIANIALTVDDDLCIMQTNDEQRLIAGCVCSPSYWNIGAKIGQPLRQIHAPVTTMNEKIGDPIERFISRAPLLQPFERVNWFIHADTERWHPVPEALPETPVATWHIRSERETLCRFSDQYLLFTIHTRFAPLAAIAHYPAAQADLLRTIQGLDDEETDYFGGTVKCQMIEDYLRALS